MRTKTFTAAQILQMPDARHFFDEANRTTLSELLNDPMPTKSQVRFGDVPELDNNLSEGWLRESL